ncbi:bacteriohemerythrin [Hydrogenophaga sp. RWCD_12]|uniref:bacteriohemerythrin n=1 Tax=Hydrogenophaga sp. RWCD_12 TaxID=3391190 RepID=UPI003984A26D
MTHLNWTTDLETGIREIDGQHKRIVEYINQLYDARDHHDRAAVGAVIDEMVDYTLSHFAFEESLMADAGYMFAGPHKKIHELFTRKVGEYRMRFDAGEDVASELHAMLSRWLFNHIRNDDRSYSDAVKVYLKNVSHGDADMKAQIKEELIRELHLNKKKGFFARLFGGGE